MMCSAAQCDVTNKKYLQVADTKLCICNITNIYIYQFTVHTTRLTKLAIILLFFQVNFKRF